MDLRHRIAAMRAEKRRHLTLEDLPFEGIIAHVEERLVRNKYTKTKGPMIVAVFEGGREFILELPALETLAEWFGEQTDQWPGRSFRITTEPHPTRHGQVIKRVSRLSDYDDDSQVLPDHRHQKINVVPFEERERLQADTHGSLKPAETQMPRRT